ncbi:hypothetical protein HAX54_008675, partial [Datura stramonium]|nr:hypothetical protein [Datura stramonium]
HLCSMSNFGLQESPNSNNINGASDWYNQSLRLTLKVMISGVLITLRCQDRGSS